MDSPNSHSYNFWDFMYNHVHKVLLKPLEKVKKMTLETRVRVFKVGLRKWRFKFEAGR